MNFIEIEEKHKTLIEIAKKKMNKVEDKEHDINHINDVVNNIKRILDNVDTEVNKEACIIGAYWHDVGRTEIGVGHEKLSATMLSKEMKKLNYEDNFIDVCTQAIEFHKWNMTPTTVEGWVIKDADKLAWIGSGRWESCIQDKQRLDVILELLPKLRNEILHFDYTRKMYDEEIIKIVKILYKKTYNIIN